LTAINRTNASFRFGEQRVARDFVELGFQATILDEITKRASF